MKGAGSRECCVILEQGPGLQAVGASLLLAAPDLVLGTSPCCRLVEAVAGHLDSARDLLNLSAVCHDARCVPVRGLRCMRDGAALHCLLAAHGRHRASPHPTPTRQAAGGQRAAVAQPVPPTLWRAGRGAAARRASRLLAAPVPGGAGGWVGIGRVGAGWASGMLAGGCACTGGHDGTVACASGDCACGCALVCSTTANPRTLPLPLPSLPLHSSTTAPLYPSAGPAAAPAPAWA